MTMKELIVLALAIGQIARWLVYDTGPLRIFERLRDRVGASARVVKAGTLAELFNCPSCMTVCVAIPVLTAFLYAPDVTKCLCYPLAVTMLAAIATRMASR